MSVVLAVENATKVHQLTDRKLLAVAPVADYVAVPRVTLEGTQRDVDIPLADLVIHKLSKLDVDSKAALGIAHKERQDLHRCPLERLKSWEAFELSNVETS